MAAATTSVASLTNPAKSGFLTKQGGKIKTWKRRWFVLKGDTLYYFKSPTDRDKTGSITVETGSICKLEVENKKKKNCFFSVSTKLRTYMMYADNEQSAKEWVDLIVKAINDKKGGGSASSGGSIAPPASSPAPSTPASTPAPAAAPATPKVEATPAAAPATKTDNVVPKSGGSDGKKDFSPRHLIAIAKGVIPYLQDEESKILEFWQIWSESIPPLEDLVAGQVIDYTVSASADVQKLTWRTSGPQNVFIQKMVDFFWNVGAPESEIDRLNDVGALINPAKIGSWIDMSAKGGMDGGWFFPVDIPMKTALESTDPGEPSRKVQEWAEKHHIEKCYSVGRDMGAAPPRQTELRIRLPGADFSAQLAVAMDAYVMFNFPQPPEGAMQVLNELKPSMGMNLSIITSSEGFVRLGLLIPKPPTTVVAKLCSVVNATNDELAALEGSLGTDGPTWVEYQFLKEGFGYGVYKEGFDVVFHYHVGDETNTHA